MIIYETIAGSRLYGYHTPQSDYDYRGVFLAPKNELLGLTPCRQTVESTVTDDASGETTDNVYYELRRFCDLALKGNPNILEILFSVKHTHNVYWEYWKPFYTNRHTFLSQQVRKPYLGFLTSEIKKLEKAYDNKAAANAWRLAYQGYTILLSGNFNPTLPVVYSSMFH